MSFDESIAELELVRIKLQKELDDTKSTSERNVLGQFATPRALALELLEQTTHYSSESEIRFLDPAIGTGAFFSALRSVYPSDQIVEARGYEVDPHYGEPAKKLWRGSGLDIRVEDFTKVEPPTEDSSFNLVVCNPPYVRHHHLPNEVKKALHTRAKSDAGVSINGLAGLYCYFLTLSHRWMTPDALACWLIPSEFMDVNYGVAVKQYLLDCVTLLHIHRFDPAEIQFGDALVSSTVVWFKNVNHRNHHTVRMTYGGSISKPRTERQISVGELREARKWTRLPYARSRQTFNVPTVGDFFNVKRGIATGDNQFFILDRAEIDRRNLPWSMFRPILPSPRNLTSDEVECDEFGNPILEPSLFLLECRQPIEVVKREYPELWEYLEEGRERGVSDGYVCSHRSPWYAQENRPAAPFLCTYLGRARKDGKTPFRFILNRSMATAPNVYLMLYPTDRLANALIQESSLIRKAWRALRSISPQTLFSEGRVYGGGLHKLEPRELANVPASELGTLFSDIASKPKQSDLFEDLTLDDELEVSVSEIQIAQR